MAQTTSAVLAALLKYDELDPVNFPDGVRPPVYFDLVPQTDATGAQLRPPYVRLEDGGQNPTLADFERTTLEVCEFAFEVRYVNDLGKVAKAIEAIRFNGGTKNDGFGFDYGELPALALPRDNYQILRGETRFRAESFDRDGKPVYLGTIRYKITLREAP